MFSIDKLSQLLLGAKAKEDLPSYIRIAIKDQQLESEKLLSWILLLFIFVIAILYQFVPTHESTIHHHTVVVIVVSFYLLFAIMRVFLAQIKYSSEWFLILSSILDVLILMSLVWSFHIIYHMPPVFYLKLPFISYVYVLLALRMLLFEPKYILVVGITSITCYLLLLYYALAYSPPNTRTYDYAKYIGGEYIYLPGEFNKILSIFLVMTVLTLAVIRGRRLLIRAIAEARAAKELSRFFEPQIATNIIDSNEDIKPGYGKQRDAAIIYCDIRGFTESSKRMSPAELMQLLTEYQSIMVRAALDHHGSIDKFLGDGILISFNAITQHGDTYAADALRAAFYMSEANQRWQYKRKKAGLNVIRIGISIAAGSVTVGVVGDVSRLEFTVIGDPVNLSAKLDKHCKMENCEILTTLHTYNLAIKQGFKYKGNIEKRSAIQVDGVAELVDLVILKR